VIEIWNFCGGSGCNVLLDCGTSWLGFTSVGRVRSGQRKPIHAQFWSNSPVASLGAGETAPGCHYPEGDTRIK